MKPLCAMVLIGLLFSPAFGQTPVPRSQVPPSQGNLGSAVTYEDCVTRCKKCGSGQNPECIREFCSGYPHRKRGAKPLPVVCPEVE
jgi:hypothetical protein